MQNIKLSKNIHFVLKIHLRGKLKYLNGKIPV